MRACHVLALACLLLAMPANAVAQDADSDVPAFDRPGLGLGTDIVPRAAAALELGLPSYARDKDRDGIRSEQSSGDATVRTGLAPQLELQLSGSLWQQQRTRVPGQSSQRVHGHGDTLVALKWSPSAPDATDRWALLASGTLARGQAAFSDGRQYAVAASYERDFSDAWSGALFASHSRGDGERSTVWSPSLALALGPRLSTYVEAGITHTRGQPRQSVAGAGVTWAWTARLQLDASFDVGLDADSPDLQAGVGLAAFFD